MFDKEIRELNAKITELVARRLRQKNSVLMSEDNDLHYSHGESWSHVDASTGERNVGTFVEQSAEVGIPFQKIIDNDASAIASFVEELAEKMHGQMARSVYQMISTTAEAVGNSAVFTPVGDLSPEQETQQVHEDLLTLLEKIEFGVDRFGAASAPQLHVHPDNTRLIRALNTPASPEFERRLDAVQQRKETEAVGKEAARLRRYKR